MEKYIQLGKDIGLNGQELLDFVREEVEKEESKEKERLLREEDRERVKLEREEIKEKERLEREQQREERLLEREMKKMQLEHEEKDKQFAIEMEKIKQGEKKEEMGGGASKAEIKAKLPKLPPFNEKQDSMDAYLKRFERFAHSAKWEEEDWATHLSALLQGKALDVYSRLSVTDALDYEALKTALLKRFQLTEEGFRGKFRNSKADEGETPRQFVVRIEDYLMRWMDLAKVTRDFEGLKDLMLREQFLQSSPKALQIFLKERKVSSVAEMAELAEQYQEAHGIQLYVPNKSGSTPSFGDNRKHSNSSNYSHQERGRNCYICRGGSHLARDCPNKFGQRNKIGAASVGNRRNGRYISRSGYVGRGGRNVGYRGGRGGERYDVQNGVADRDKVGCFAQGKYHRPIEDQLTSDIVGSGQKGNVAHSGNRTTRCKLDNMPVSEGFVNGKQIQVLRDSGCSSVVVRRDLVGLDCLSGSSQTCILLDGTVRKFPVATVFIDTPFYKGEVEALCAEYPVFDLIVGNIPGVKDPSEVDIDMHRSETDVNDDCDLGFTVQTRAAKAKENIVTKMKVTDPVDPGVGVEEFKKAQEEDSTLDKVREKVKSGEKVERKSGAKTWFEQSKGLVYRYFQSNMVENGKIFKQACVPKGLRCKVMKLAHDSLMSGHLGIKKTYEKILYNFWWPGINGDVTRYCRSCDICQKTFPKGKTQKIPIGEMPIIDTPFARVAVDIIGPINPPSERKHRFILTMVDYASRYPEAVALKQITTESVAEALLEMFSRVGVPCEILSDMGRQFISGLMQEINRLLSVKQLTTAPYNPACNGLVERFNGTLKSMLKKMCSEKPRDWDRYIAPLLFAYREAPQESTGFSPFELLYGRTVRGPLQILKELWTKEIDSNETKTTYEYVVDLRNRLEDTLKVAKNELSKNQVRYKKYADRGKKRKRFEVGDKVLVLLPTDNSKLLMHLKGPYEVTSRVNDFDYKIRVDGKEKIYHANLLRKYVERDESMAGLVESEKSVAVETRESACVAVVEEEGSDVEEVEVGVDMRDIVKECDNQILKVELLPLEATEGVDDVQINPDLCESRQKELKALVNEFSDVFTDLPGTTDLVEHELKLTSDIPVRSKPYPIPGALRESFKKDISKMLKMGVIEPCDSPYASPVVIVKKPDNTNRVCIDYRKVNALTVFDSQPMGNPDYIFDKLVNAKFLSKIDLAKGYWQIKVKDSCKAYTAFVCSEGLFSFNKMPFGMVNSGATFCRMMRKLLDGLDGVDNFVDDVLDFSQTWEIHLGSLRLLFGRLRSSHLTARPSKCKLGYTNMDFLGHVVGDGKLQPNPDKVKSLLDCKRPTTKTQVRSFLGLVGYYRKFIPNFSTIATCLTDMTKKGNPNKVVWTDEAEQAFCSLIGYLTKSPILCLPDWKLQFILRTDASDCGIGCVLMQEHGESNFPVAYASRKLLPRERRYSTIEKEGLAIVWGIQKFQCYLYGKEFVLETDHAPLIHMNRAKVTNPRIMRWVLALQPYRFRVDYIKGSDNVGADFLSRS